MFPFIFRFFFCHIVSSSTLVELNFVGKLKLKFVLQRTKTATPILHFFLFSLQRQPAFGWRFVYMQSLVCIITTTTVAVSVLSFKSMGHNYIQPKLGCFVSIFRVKAIEKVCIVFSHNIVGKPQKYSKNRRIWVEKFH